MSKLLLTITSGCPDGMNPSQLFYNNVHLQEWSNNVIDLVITGENVTFNENGTATLTEVADDYQN